jgi:hypothetical protein
MCELLPEPWDILLLTSDPSTMQKVSLPREIDGRHLLDKFLVECRELHE